MTDFTNPSADNLQAQFGPQPSNLSLNGSPGFYVPSGWGKFWRPKLAAAQAGDGKAVVSVLSDSLGHYYASTFDRAWAGIMKSTLQGPVGGTADGGSGVKTIWDTSTMATFLGINSTGIAAYQANGSLITPVGTWTQLAHSAGPAGNYMLGTVDNVTPASMTFTTRGTDVYINVFGNSGANATYTYSIDGAAAVTVVDAVFGPAAVTHIAGLARTSHTVKIAYADAGTKNLYVISVRGENATGVLIDNYSNWGQQSSVWNGSDFATGGAGGAVAYSAGRNRVPDLLIYTMGVNDDAVGNVAADTYIQNIGHTIAECKDAAGTTNAGLVGATDVVFLMHHIGSHDTNNLWTSYKARLRALADSCGAALIDMWALGQNSWNYWNAQGYWANPASPGAAGTDTIHLSDAGYAAVAAAVNSLVTITH